MSGGSATSREVAGQLLNRYRVWHPFDHVSARYVRRARDGSIGPGAQIALCEVLGRNPRFTIDVVSTIEKMDEDGFVHNVVIRGMTLARMEHTFREVPGGTIDENCLIVPGSHRLAFFSRVLVPWKFQSRKDGHGSGTASKRWERWRTSSRTSTYAR